MGQASTNYNGPTCNTPWQHNGVQVASLHRSQFTRWSNSNAGFGGRRRGVMVSGVRRMNEVNARRVRLVPEWVTVFGRVYHLGM